MVPGKYSQKWCNKYECPVEERREIIEDYYDTYKVMVREYPGGHSMDYVHAYMVISKII